MIEITSSLKKKYVPGFDCRLATFRNTLAVQNVTLSNSMMLGIAGSLIFCFNDNKYYSRLSEFVVAGISDQSLEYLTSHLNLYLFKGRMYDIATAEVELNKYLSMGLPVNIAINRKILQEYCGQQTGQINMGYHYVTITAYDEEQGCFTLFETDSPHPIRVTKEQLNHIWFSDLIRKREDIDPFQLCDGQWYTFKCKQIRRQDLAKVSLLGISKVINNFFTSPISEIFGIEALQKFCDTVSGWEHPEDIELLKRSLSVLNAMESGMSGGGLGRKLFGYFLSELSEIMRDQEIKLISIEYTELAVLWKSLVRMLNIYFGLFPGQVGVIHFDMIKQTVKRIERKEIECMSALKNWYFKTKENGRTVEG